MYIINENYIQQALEIAVSGGADFAEVYAEYTHNVSMSFLDKKIENVGDNIISGVGIRAFVGTKTVYASTSDTSFGGIMTCARAVASATVAEALIKGSTPSIILRPSVVADIHPIRMNPCDADISRRADILRTACFAAIDTDTRISQVQGGLLGVDHTILVANSEGLLKTDRHIRTRISVNAVASDDSRGANENQAGSCAPGRGMGLEMFENIAPTDIGKHAARQALVNLGADYCKAGQMTVAIENGFGGVIFHEACGHSLEATQVGVGMSEMCGKLGQKIANEKITAIDDGTIPNAWGSVNIDDEGNPTQRNVLIENGVLKKYMIDRLGSRRLGMAMTGNSRRQNYSYEATSRMTNTFIDNGPDKNEDIIASIEYGLYAKEMGGGSVDPLTGAFNFSVREGYMVRNGKICEPVRGASLIGTGSKILMDIDMVGNNLATGQGMCGSSSGSVPTDVGQPLIRVAKITVGGR